MNPEYEYYGTYDEDASGQVNLDGQVRDFLLTMELMFDFIEVCRPEILDEFVGKVADKYTKELQGTSFALDSVGFDQITKDESLLSSYPQFKKLRGLN